MGIAFQILALVAIIAGIWRGFREGITGQTDALAGIAFGTVTTYALGPTLTSWLADTYPQLTVEGDSVFLPSVLSATALYMGFFLFFNLVGAPLRRIGENINVGVVNGLAGALTGLFKYVIALSLAFNLIVGFDHKSVLMHYATSDDGNLSEAVMLLAPAVLDMESYEDLAHRIQLREASKISQNRIVNKSVTYIKDNRETTLLPARERPGRTEVSDPTEQQRC